MLVLFNKNYILIYKLLKRLLFLCFTMKQELHDFLIEKHGAIYYGKPVLILPSQKSRRDLLLSRIRNEKHSFNNFFEFYKTKIIESILYNKSNKLDLRSLRGRLERKAKDERYSFVEKDFLEAANCVWFNYFSVKRD